MKILPGGDPSTWTLETVLEIIKNVINIGAALGSGIAVILILVGAFYYFTAYGNEEKAQKGKTIIMWAIIGIVVILLADVLVATLQKLLI